MTYIDQIAADVQRHLSPKQQPSEHAQDLYRLYALLVLTRGEAVTLEDVHNAWATWITRWDPAHAAAKPFVELSTQTQLEDRPYAEAIRAAARDMRETARH